MKKLSWHRQHKWLGLICGFFLTAFCVSGIVLNHRQLFGNIDVSRGLLPTRYHYKDWNGGLLRGTVPSDYGTLIYGTNGVWCVDSLNGDIRDFNIGFPGGADYRNVRRVVNTENGMLIAVTPFGAYRHSADIGWVKLDIAIDGDERLTDVEASGDSIVVLGRSDIYVAVSPYLVFDKKELFPSPDSDGKVSLFRTVWTVHSGEIYGLAGRLFTDMIALILSILVVTGTVCWFLPLYLKKHKAGFRPMRFMRFNILWHNKIGRLTIVLTVFIVFTGWCLRPPVMIPLAMTKTAVIPGSSLSSDNVWHDKLRAIRYDDRSGDWLISTSDGFFTIKSFDDVPRKLSGAPPVSVMGINVWEKSDDDKWLCGSFSGMYEWDRSSEVSSDYFTHEIAEDKPGSPFGRKAISGYSADLTENPFVVEYYDGTDALVQPEELKHLPMSLWNVALEIHSGRMFIGQIATYIFIFISGLAIIWCLISGYKLTTRGTN
ncbi:MAG: PepSY-associated TM helix domain-containing protein [Bacteroidales bacterium]|nr:PepSY-associated TM helix domain-containing protein [Bacteroidales bacterium]